VGRIERDAPLHRGTGNASRRSPTAKADDDNKMIHRGIVKDGVILILEDGARRTDGRRAGRASGGGVRRATCMVTRLREG
jgi:hypothetical protein